MLKKVTVLMTALLFAATTSFAQLGIKAGYNAGLPMNTGTSETTFYNGFYAGVDYKFTDHFRAEILYEGFLMKESAIMPATVGADFSFLNGSFHPYAGANVGTYLTNTAGRTTANFGLHPKIGVFYELGDHFSIDLAFKYHFTFFKNANTQMVGANLGVGYRF